MPKIYEKHRGYHFARHYVDLMIRRSYRRIVVQGQEKLPKDGAIILAPNHCNTLMDALVVLRSSNESMVFGARADIFRKPLIAAILRWLRIVPMTRARDGLRNVENNRDSFSQAVETLEHGVRYCMFSEGRHRPKHSLLPITKGIVRIAFAANEKFGSQRPVYIVPVGLEYGDYFRFKTTSVMSYGEPINVTDFVRENSSLSEADRYSLLQKEIHERISQLITYIPDDENYEGRWSLVKQNAPLVCDPVLQLQNDREAAARALEASPEVLSEAEDFEKRRIAAKISSKAFGRCALLDGLFSLLLLPVFIFSLAAASPMLLPSLTIVKKIKDKAFRNTARFAVRLVLYPFVLIAWALGLFLTLKWFVALPLFLCALPSYSVFYRLLEYYRVTLSEFRLLKTH